MPRYAVVLLLGLSVTLSLAAEPTAESGTDSKAEPSSQSQTPPATKPAVPVHPLLGQTTFVVDPKEMGGKSALADQVGPITVSLNYHYDDLPGLDLKKLSPERRKRVIERANREICTCGCRGDTVARCLVKDPNCQLVKSLAKQIYEEERVRPLTSPSKP